MKHLFKKLIVCCLLLDTSAAVHAANGIFGGGDGTSDTPFLIEDAADLDAVRDNLSASYRLANDIDLTAYLASRGAGYAKWGSEGWEPIGGGGNSFFGTFDGDYHKITGLWINRSTDYIGLFGFTDATIKNLGVEIAAEGVNGKSAVGGLVGYQGTGNSIINCYTTGNVNGVSVVGGLVGVLNGNISNCYATGNVSGSGSGSVGGFSVGGSIGGLVGYQMNYSLSVTPIVISDCYATGNVSGTTNIGGLVGYQRNVNDGIYIIISNCYATGGVTGDDNVGGLVGNQQNSTITNSFFDTETTGQTDGVGSDPTATGVTGKTTAAMQTQATFTTAPANWNFTTVWGLYLKNNNKNIPGYGYPYLGSFKNDILITPTSDSKPYDGLPAPTSIAYTVIPNEHYDGVKHPLAGELAYSGSDPNFINADDYAIVQNTLTNPHYQISFKNDEIYSITPKSITVKAKGGSSVYGESPVNPGILINEEDLVEGETLSGLANSFGMTAITPVGTYELQVIGTPTNGNYFVSTDTGTWVIKKRPITIKADDITIAEGAIPTLTYSIINNTSLANDDVLSGALAVEDDDFSFGVHDIIQGTLTASDNYDVTFVGGTLTVVIITDIIVDGQSAQRSDITTFYAVAECGKTEALVVVTADPALTVEINGVQENSSTVDLDYGDNIIYVTVTTDGNAQTYTLFILRPYDQVEYEYDDVPTVNCNTQSNGGYDFTDFQWYRNGVAIDDAANPYIQIKDNATYYCRITLSNGIQWRTCDIQHAARPVNSLKAYPNPTQGLVTINHEQLSTGKVQVFDMYGKLVLLPSTNPFDMSALPNGMYVIKVNGETVKIIKK